MRKETIIISYKNDIYKIKELSRKLRVPISTLKYRYENGLDLRRGTKSTFINLDTGEKYPSLLAACNGTGENYSRQHYLISNGKPLTGNFAPLKYRWKKSKCRDNRLNNWITSRITEITYRINTVRNSSCTEERRKHLHMGTQKMIQFIQHVKENHYKLTTKNSKEFNAHWKHLQDEYNVEVM